MGLALDSLPGSLLPTWDADLHHAHVVILDGSCSSRLTMAAAWQVLCRELGTGLQKDAVTAAVLVPARAGRWPMPRLVPSVHLEQQASPMKGLPTTLDRVWETLQRKALQEWAIAALDPTGCCCRLLLNHVSDADLTAVLDCPETPLLRPLNGLGDGTNPYGLGIYCRWMALSANEIRGMYGDSTRNTGPLSVLLGHLHAVSNADPSQDGAHYYVKYIGQGVCMAACWEQADKPDGGGRALPRPFQNLAKRALVRSWCTLSWSRCVQAS
jgi:hypothetical protein